MAACHIAQSGAGAGLTAATTYYLAPMMTLVNTDTTEANRQVTWREAGTFTKARAQVSANSSTTASTLTLRVAGSDSILSISITALTTGEFTDTDNVAVTDGQAVSLKIVVGATAGITIQMAGVNFTPTDTTATVMPSGAAGSLAITAASSTRYNDISGDLAFGTTAANVVGTVRNATTLRNLFCYVSANARTATTLKMQEAGVDSGTLSLSIPASTTGYFEDTDTDTFASGATARMVVVTGTGTNSMTVALAGVWQDSTNQDWTWLASRSGTTGGTSTASVTQYFRIAGQPGNSGATLSSNELRFPATAGFVANMDIWISSNARTTTTTFGVRIANVNSTNISISVGASTSGVFSDTDTEAVAAEDRIAAFLTTGTGTGGIAYTYVSARGYIPSSTSRPNLRSGGSFSTKPVKYRSAGSFAEKQMKLKVSGSWVNV